MTSNPKEIILEKTFSRGYSLFVADMWRESDRNHDTNLFGKNVTEALWLRPDNENLLEVWYSSARQSERNQFISEKARDNEWFSKVCASFDEHWQPLHHYYVKKETLTLDELKGFHDHMVAWWAPMMIMYEGPQADVTEQQRAEMVRLRESVERFSDKDDVLFFASAQAIYPDKEKYFSVLRPEEIFTGSIPMDHILDARKNGWYLTPKEFGLGNELPKVLAANSWTLGSPVSADISEVTGTSAYRGIVSGKVRLVRTSKDIRNVLENDIIVSPMTLPDFLPAMKKAAAFVTDEGGITCHAAIVARELKKPCVIGTKYATRIFKDGDMIEVDADNGIVRKI